MKTIPEGLGPYKRTAVFTQDSIPPGLLRSHSTRRGAWAKIVVLSGELKYTILSDPPEVWVLSPELPGIIEEAALHEVAALGPVQFYVEFYRAPGSSTSA